ncbi:MAG: MFS transporter [Sphingomonadaceae bacterium]|nr:MFS transporter [Sphingomonadaceae bacterium]
MTEGERRSGGYQAMLVGLLSLNFGILFFDRNALNFLMPFVQPDLGLSFTQVGLLGSALSLTWALAGFFVGWLSDRTGKRKIIIVLATVLFSFCSVASGLASSFAMLLAARLLMGLAEGGVLPISHSLVAEEVSPERRGLAMGVTQNLGSNLLGSAAAPLILIPVALAWGWRDAFFLAAAPGLISAVLVLMLVKERSGEGVPGAPREKLTLGQAFGQRNILLCALIAILLVSYLVVCWAFMPLILTQLRGFDPDTVKWLMATLGISAGIGAFVVPGISDLIGRRPVMIAAPLLGVILPLGALYFDGSAWVLAAIFFFGWALTGIFPLFMATVPSETVDARHIATVMGMVMGTGEILGGVLSPFVAGAAADRFGLAAPLWIMLGLTLGAGLLAMGLKETAPRIVARRAAFAGLAT